MPAEYTAIQAVQNHWPVLVTDCTPGMKKVALDRPVCIVGARSRVHLPLPSQLVSKAHALIIHESDGVYLRDLASRNKTFVNNRAVRETRLRDNDLIRFGPFTFRCHRGFSMTADAEQKTPGMLRIQSERGSTKVITLDKQTFLIGSRYSCDLMLTGDQISLAHAIIFEREGRRYVRDLTSLSGTLLNDQLIRESELNAGDEISIGTSRIKYNHSDAPDPHPEEAVAAPSPVDPVLADAAAFATGVPSPREIELPWEKSPPLVFEMKRERREGE